MFEWKIKCVSHSGHSISVNYAADNVTDMLAELIGLIVSLPAVLTTPCSEAPLAEPLTEACGGCRSV